MNYAKISYEVKGIIEVAPINAHYVLGDLTGLLKDISNLQQHGIKSDGVSMKLNLEYLPVRDEDRITQEKVKNDNRT